MNKPLLENNFKELSRLRPPRFAKLRLRIRLWKHYLQMRKEQGNFLLRFSRAITIAAGLVIAITSVSFTTIYAYRSDDITAFTALYPIKQSIETLTLAFTENPVEKVEMYLELAAKRTREVHKQLATNRKIDPDTLTAIKDNTAQAVIAAQKITDKTAKKDIEKKIVAASNQQVTTLKAAKATSVKIAAESQDISLKKIAGEEISLGTTEVPRSTAKTIDDVQLNSTPTSSEMLVAATPELSLIESVLNDSKKFTDEKVVQAELEKNADGEQKGSSTGSTILDHQGESVSLSLNLP